MRLSLDTPSTITPAERGRINELAAQGFGYDDPTDMQDDTDRHIEAAELVQQATTDGRLIGFALYRSALWRSRH